MSSNTSLRSSLTDLYLNIVQSCFGGDARERRRKWDDVPSKQTMLARPLATALGSKVHPTNSAALSGPLSPTIGAGLAPIDEPTDEATTSAAMLAVPSAVHAYEIECDLPCLVPPVVRAHLHAVLCTPAAL